MSFERENFHVVLVEGSVAQRLAIGDVLALCNMRCTVFEKPSQAIDFLKFYWSKRQGSCRPRVAEFQTSRSRHPTVFPTPLTQESATVVSDSPLGGLRFTTRRPSLGIYGASGKHCCLTQDAEHAGGDADSRPPATTFAVDSCEQTNGRGACSEFSATRHHHQHSVYKMRLQNEKRQAPNLEGYEKYRQRCRVLSGRLGWRQTGSVHLLRAPHKGVHLVLCDISFSDDKEVFRLLAYTQNRRKRRHVPVLLLASPQEPDAHIAGIVAAGAVGCLRTPVTMKVGASLPLYVDLPAKIDEAHSAPGVEQHQLSEGSSYSGGETEDLANVYEQVGIVGRGATSTIYLVRRLSDSKLLALKDMFLALLSPRERAMTINEIAIMRRLRAPPMIGYSDSWIEGDSLKIIMEYADGGTLHDFIQRHKERRQPIPFSLIASERLKEYIVVLHECCHALVSVYSRPPEEWTASLGVGLEILHQHNIIHRDLKGQNVLLTRFLEIRLCDFGASKLLSNQTMMAKTAVGTPFFMSPEASSGTPYGTSSDLWALGVLLYELLYLRRPFDGISLQALFQAIQTVEPAWHSYSSCDGFCVSKNAHLEHQTISCYSGHNSQTFLGRQQMQLEFQTAQPNSDQCYTRSKHQTAVPPAGAVGISGIRRGSVGNCSVSRHPKAENKTANAEQNKCNFLASSRRRQLQELVKRLLSKNPANRPTALDVCCHPLFLVDVVRFLKSRKASDSAALLKKVLEHRKTGQYQWQGAYSFPNGGKSGVKSKGAVQSPLESRGISSGDDFKRSASDRRSSEGHERPSEMNHFPSLQTQAALSVHLTQRREGKTWVDKAEKGKRFSLLTSSLEAGTGSAKSAFPLKICSGDKTYHESCASASSAFVVISNSGAAAELAVSSSSWLRDDAETQSGDPSTPSVGVLRSPCTPLYIFSRQDARSSRTVGGSSSAAGEHLVKAEAHRQVLCQAAIRRPPAPHSARSMDPCNLLPPDRAPVTDVAKKVVTPQFFPAIPCRGAKTTQCQRQVGAPEESTASLPVQFGVLKFCSPHPVRKTPVSERGQRTHPTGRLQNRPHLQCTFPNSLANATREECTECFKPYIGFRFPVCQGGPATAKQRQPKYFNHCSAQVPHERHTCWEASEARTFTNAQQSILKAHANCSPTLRTLAQLLLRFVRTQPHVRSSRSRSSCMPRFLAVLAGLAATALTAVEVASTAVLVVMYGDLSLSQMVTNLGFIGATMVASALLWTAAFEVGGGVFQEGKASVGLLRASDALNWLQHYLQVSRERAASIFQGDNLLSAISQTTPELLKFRV